MKRALLVAAILAVALVPAARASDAAVSIQGFAFSPKTVSVNVGDSVTWTNHDGETHTATGDGGAFDTGLLGPGQSGKVAFSVPGTFSYHCKIHPTMTGTVIVTSLPPPDQKPPVARFTLAVKNLDATVDSSASTDPDGQIVNRSWDWGDGNATFGVTSTHAYAKDGDYRVVLRVRDDQRLTSEDQQTARIRDAAPPVAALAVTSAGLVATADASATTADLTLITTRWRFGDGAALACDEKLACSPSGPGDTGIVAGKRAATHAYLRGGSFDVTLFVRDAHDRDSETNTTIKILDPRPVDLQPRVVNSTVTLDASRLPRYGNATFAWAFGDGGNASGPIVTHAFPYAGRWNVTLAMTDEVGTQDIRDVANVGPFPAQTTTTPAPTSAAAKPTPAPAAWTALLAALVVALARRGRGPESPK